MPSWLGRVPSDVGYASAGNLSADEYKTLALVYLPIVVSLLTRLASLYSISVLFCIDPVRLVRMAAGCCQRT